MFRAGKITQRNMAMITNLLCIQGLSKKGEKSTCKKYGYIQNNCYIDVVTYAYIIQEKESNTSLSRDLFLSIHSRYRISLTLRHLLEKIIMHILREERKINVTEIEMDRCIIH